MERQDDEVRIEPQPHGDEAQPENPSHAGSRMLSRVLSGSFWLVLKTPIAAVTTFMTVPLMIRNYGDSHYGAYGFAWGFGFFQMLLEFGMSSALQRSVVTAWARNDREAVRRCVASGMIFYAIVTVVQAILLLVIAYGTVPYTEYSPEDKRLIVNVLWLQAITAPCWGLSTVISAILQAAHRYDFIPRLEVVVVIGRFLALVLGIRAGLSLLSVVWIQTIIQIGLTLGPAIWIVVRQFGIIPGFRGASWQEFKDMIPMSLWVFMIQLSVVIADKLDTTILGFVMDDPGPANSIYMVVSKPFMQLRQTGWMLAYFVMPAAATLIAARDSVNLDRITYDGARYHFGLLLPIGLSAWIYASPFLEVWVGPAKAQYAPLMQLFLIACVPLILAVPVQIATGQGNVRPIALAAFGGAVVNLPLSYVLTLRMGVAGVIWGTVLTSLVSNLLLPGIYTFRVLNIRLSDFFRRCMAPVLMGGVALIAASQISSRVWDIWAVGPSRLEKTWMLVAHLTICVSGYVLGYFVLEAGRRDLHRLLRRFRKN
jgi:O-antigen/teichoic acid export membrane protein